MKNIHDVVSFEQMSYLTVTINFGKDVYLTILLEETFPIILKIYMLLINIKIKGKQTAILFFHIWSNNILKVLNNLDFFLQYNRKRFY